MAYNRLVLSEEDSIRLRALLGNNLVQRQEMQVRRIHAKALFLLAIPLGICAILLAYALFLH